VFVHATYGWSSYPEGYIAIEPRDRWLVAFDLDGSTAPIIHDFTHAQAPQNLAAQGIVTSMNAAIGEGSGVFGTIAVHSPLLRQFTEDEVAFLRAMASLISVAVQKYRREDHLQQLREHVLLCQVQLSRASDCRASELLAHCNLLLVI
jgi:GAF domain-containing protein